MSPPTRGTVLLLSAAVVSAASPAHEPHNRTAAEHYSRRVAAYEVPDVTLVDSTGTAVDLRGELDRPGPLVLQFIFTSCTTVCPVLNAILETARDDLRGVRLLSITIDPEHDTPARLAALAQRVGAGPQWRFLTGRLADIDQVRKAFDAYTPNKMEHRPLTFLRAAPGSSWVRLEGLPSAAELAAEVHQLSSP